MLIAQTRQAGEGLQNFRKAQKLPGVVYGHGFDSIPVVLNMLHFNTILREQGKGGLIDLKIDDAPPCKVLIHDYQIHLEWMGYLLQVKYEYLRYFYILMEISQSTTTAFMNLFLLKIRWKQKMICIDGLYLNLLRR